MRREPIPALQSWHRHAAAMAWARRLQRLPDRQRAALLLRDTYGFSTEEVAEILQTRPAVIETMLARARSQLSDPRAHGHPA